MSLTRRASLTLLHSLTLAILSCSLAFAQSFTASVRGTAKDVSGGLIPLASVTIAANHSNNYRGSWNVTVHPLWRCSTCPAHVPSDCIRSRIRSDTCATVVILICSPRSSAGCARGWLTGG